MVKRMLKLITYSGKRPNAVQIKEQIIKNRDYSYLVATKALEKERRQELLLPEHQKPIHSKNNSYPIAVFHQVLREWIGKKVKIASRGEEKTMIKRSIKKIARKDEVLRTVLKQDISSWIRALAEMAEKGHDLTSGIPEHLAGKLVNPFVGDLLKDLQQEYYREFEENGLTLFEKEAHKQIPFLDEIMKPVLIMEGFTFLTPLQELLVKWCDRKRVEVVFLVPDNPSQGKGFEIIKKTYIEKFDKLELKHLANEPVSKKDDIRTLQYHLFSTPFFEKECKSQNVQMISYPNRDREIYACIEQLKTWFTIDGYKPNEVAVVVRQPNEFKERLQDFLHSACLTYNNSKGELVPVEVPSSSRLLLLTPVGRFILTLYEIWQENHLLVTHEQLETVLSSGWLGASMQDSTIEFRAVKHQYFLHCETKKQWEEAFEFLEKIIDDKEILSERMPISLATQKNVEYWRQSINLLEDMCRRLFKTNQGGIGNHIQLLLDQLQHLDVNNVRKYEKDVLQKIQEVFEELQDLYSINMTTSEFGDALHALVNQQSDEEGDEVDIDLESRLWIATPEGIDGVERKAILYLAVDNQHVPGKLQMPWPFFEDVREKHLQQERYMFLTIVRATTDKLVFTCCRNDGDSILEPSTYLNEIEKLLKIEIANPELKNLIDIDLAPEFIDSVHRTPHRRKRFKLTELVQYGLCPLRYNLEMRHPEAKVYRNDWQLEIFAQGVWMENTFELLSRYYNKNRKTQGVQEVYNLFCRAMEHAKPNVEKLFPSFSQVTWHGIKQRIQHQFNYYASKRGQYKVYFEKGTKGTVEILNHYEESQPLVEIDIDIPFYMMAGKIKYPLLDSVSCYEWLLPGKKDEDEEEPYQEHEDNVHLFSKLYTARQWWNRTVDGVIASEKQNRTPYELDRYSHYEESKELMLNWINGIWNNKFPSNVGDHCKVCPVRSECLGIEMEGSYY